MHGATLTTLTPVSAEELARVTNEIAFWEANLFCICILKKLPEYIPDDHSIRALLARFMADLDYHAIVHRLGLLKRSGQLQLN
jgi:hypothetical protein